LTRQIKLGAFLPGGGQHVAAWRHPDSPANGATSLEFHIKLAQTAERGLFDAYFLADGLTVGMGGKEGGNAKIAGFEPVTLFAAIAPSTKNIGFSEATEGMKSRQVLIRQIADEHERRGADRNAPASIGRDFPKLQRRLAHQAAGRCPRDRGRPRAGSSRHRQGRTIFLRRVGTASADPRPR